VDSKAKIPLTVTNQNVLPGAMEQSGMNLTVASSQAAVLDGKGMAAGVRPQETIATPGNLYIPSLDGIRAISFFLVFLSHARLGDIIPGGFGVSIFFLLSGFLITTLLRTEFARYGRISLGNFYLRRVWRIMPPLYITLALAIVLCIIQQGPAAIPLGGTLAQALQVSNYYEIYADPAVTLPGSGVLWSLAVEEHFYLIFPLLYAWMCPRFSVGRQTFILLTLCAAALAWRCILHYFDFHASSVHTYLGTDARFDSILFGCVFAIVGNPVLDDPLHRWFLQRMKWLLPLCLGVLLGTFLVRAESFRETLRYTLQGLALIPLFIAAIHYQKSWPVRFLNLPVVRFLGVLSYALYLCHFIIMESIGRVWTSSFLLATVVSLACSLCFAALVHYWIERPCAKIRRRLSKALGE
jgi:peptidoglycan/LPS O-acetylase OafA/YrhL